MVLKINKLIWVIQYFNAMMTLLLAGSIFQTQLVIDSLFILLQKLRPRDVYVVDFFKISIGNITIDLWNHLKQWINQDVSGDHDVAE